MITIIKEEKIKSNGSVNIGNADKLLCVDSNGRIKTIGQIAKGFMIRGIVPYEFGLGETSTTTRFNSYAVDGATFVNSRGWPAMSVTSATNSNTAFSPTNGSSSVTQQAKYNHPSYGLNLSAPIMAEFDLLNTVIGASVELFFYISAQTAYSKSITATSGSPTVLCADTSKLYIGQMVSVASGATIAASSYIISIVTNTSVTMSSNATSSGAGSWLFFGNPSGAIIEKGYGVRIKGDGTARLETHNGTTATLGSYFATTINTTYTTASTLGSKVHLVSDGTTIYLYVNEVLITSTASPTGISTVLNTSYYTMYMAGLKGNGTAHTIQMSNPKIYY